MKTLFFALVAVIALSACSQPKDIYFNGSEGSHSGLKYDQSSQSHRREKNRSCG